MSEDRSTGVCAYCGNEYSRRGMTRHLRACDARRAAIEEAEDGPARTQIHLAVESALSDRYWLHLEMPGPEELGTLDRYLRRIWLECCGHSSRFTIGNPWRGKEVPMSTAAGRVFHGDRELTYVYDFGSTTELEVRHVDDRSGQPTAGRPVTLMARNEPPEISCLECGEPADEICHQCAYEGGGAGGWCERHAEEHPDEEHGWTLPVVNSPRMGVCGYTGPATAPAG